MRDAMEVAKKSGHLATLTYNTTVLGRRLLRGGADSLRGCIPTVPENSLAERTSAREDEKAERIEKRRVREDFRRLRTGR